MPVTEWYQSMFAQRSLWTLDIFCHVMVFVAMTEIGRFGGFQLERHLLRSTFI